MLHDPLPTHRDNLSEGEYFLVQVLKRRPSATEFEVKAAGVLRSEFRSVRKPWLVLSKADVIECDCREEMRDCCEDCFRADAQAQAAGWADHGGHLPDRCGRAASDLREDHQRPAAHRLGPPGDGQGGGAFF